ncbi:glycosyltransferase [Xylanibacter ruminicola]|nr:hypothetical protein [Xylanibacter ruminicola]
MKILVINKNQIYNIPPLISVIYILRDLGHEVHLVTCGINDTIASEFKNRGVTFEVADYANASNSIAKVCEYLLFHSYVKRVLKNLTYDYVWIEGGNTVRAIGKNLLSGKKYILQISELHEDAPGQLAAISKVIHQAQAVFMPEYNRTAIYQAWFKLLRRPYVLPNKPYFIPSEKELAGLSDKYSNYIDLFKSKKVILYQGWISKRNRDMSAFVEATARLGDDFAFVMMGRDTENSVQYYKKLYPKLVHIDFIPAPDYMLLTSLSYIGIIVYNPDKLNQTYCAPNKIYEYGAFGKPMIGNNLPGLHIIEDLGAGRVAEQDDAEALYSAIKDIDSNYQNFSNSAKRMYDDCDNKETIRRVLSQLK